MGLEGGNGERVVLVGKKPVMNYVLACLTSFQNGGEAVVLKARGRAIARAVDAALLTTERYSPGTAIRDIRIGTVEVEDEESGESSSTSSIEILLTK